MQRAGLVRLGSLLLRGVAMIKTGHVFISALLVVLLLVALSQVWAYLDISDELSDAELLRSLFTDPDCAQACYLGIEPVKTSIEEALAILTENGLAYEDVWIIGD